MYVQSCYSHEKFQRVHLHTLLQVGIAENWISVGYIHGDNCHYSSVVDSLGNYPILFTHVILVNFYHNAGPYICLQIFVICGNFEY